MKNRNIVHKNDWKTNPEFKAKVYKEFDINFDPCPFMHDISEWDGLEIEWKERNFINPPYETRPNDLKGKFVQKAIDESRKGKLCVMLLPVSTSTKLYHDKILPNAVEVRPLRGRLKFIGFTNRKGIDYLVNWHLIDEAPPEECKDFVHLKDGGQHDSMLVVFDGRKGTICDHCYYTNGCGAKEVEGKKTCFRKRN